MQRAARSIVPTDNREGFVNDGTDNSTVSNADSAAAVNAAPAAASQPAEPVRRRRGGRRVVRGTGAAGASLELQVQERAPLFEAPALPDAGTAADSKSADSSDSDESSDSQDSAERPTRRRSRRAASAVADSDSEDDRPRRSRRTVSADDFDDDDAPRSRRRSVVDDDDYDEDRPVRRRSRSRQSDDDDYEDRPVRSRSRRASMDMDDDDEDRPVRRRSRRAVADTHEDTPDERLFDAVESLPSGHEAVRRGKPMTSLLFQEPVLPAAVDAHDTADTRDDDVDDDERPSRRSRRSRSHDDDDAQPRSRRRDNRRERSRQSQLMEQDFLARRENVDRLMVVREKEHHTQISVVEDNVLVEHYVSDIQEVQTVGNIYLGRVQNVLPSMEAAFVDIGQARNGVLYAGEVNWDAARLEGQPRRIELAFKSGDPVLVQVTKDPIGHKGARLTSQVTLAGRFLVLVPSGGMTGVSRKLSERERSRLKNIVSKIAPKDMGVIIRTAAEGASEDAIVKDLESLVRQWERINAKREEFWHGKRPKLLQGEPDVAIRVVRDIFNDDFSKLIVEGDKVYDRIEEYLDTMAPDLKDKLEKWDPAEHEGKDVFDKWSIDSQLRKGMERQVYLPSGGSIVIDRTEAMTTIDVNTGRFIGKGKSLEETVTRCNLEASEEIARQLRLRDIGGMVMIDYVDMVMPANRDLVLRRLVECLARDRTKHQVAEVTSLGLVQMTRKRIGQGLVEAFSEECPTCKGRGFILHDQPTVSADYDDPYALRGGDPFVKTNKHGRGTAPAPEPAGSSADVKAKLAQIAAAAVAANNTAEE